MARTLVFLALVGCAAEPAALELPEHPDAVRTKDRQPLGARVVDADGAPVGGQPVAYESDQEKIVDVDDDGTFACQRSGVAIVSVKSNQLRASTKITCAIADRISVPEAIVLVIGEGARPLDAKVHASTGEVIADAPLTVTSRDEAVVRVDGTSLVAVAPGRAELHLASGTAKTSVSVQVVDVGGLELASPLVVAVGGGGPVPVKVLDHAGGTLDVPVRLESSDEKLVTAVDNKLVGHGFGEAKLRASVGGTSREADVLVVERQHPKPFELPAKTLARVPLEQPGYYLVDVVGTDADGVAISARVEGADCEAAGPGRKLELACEVAGGASLVIENTTKSARPAQGTYTVVRAPAKVDDRALVMAGAQGR